MLTSYNPKSFGLNNIPPFDEHNFAMWNTKAMVVLETMDYEMLKIIEKGPHIPTYQPMVTNALVSHLKQKPKTSNDGDDNKLISVNVKARAAIGNSLPNHVYHLVQNYESAKEMMETLNVAYEGTVEVQAATINNPNRRYEHFFAQPGESLTQCLTGLTIW